MSQIREISYFFDAYFLQSYHELFHKISSISLSLRFPSVLLSSVCIANLHFVAFHECFFNLSISNPFDFWSHIERVKRGRSPILFTHCPSPRFPRFRASPRISGVRYNACSSRESDLKKGHRAKIGSRAFTSAAKQTRVNKVSYMLCL